MTPDDGLAKRVAFMGAERVAALFSDLELYQSRADLRRAVRTALVPSSKAVFLGNGTDLSRFDPRAVDVEVRGAVFKVLDMDRQTPVIVPAGVLLTRGDGILWDGVPELNRIGKVALVFAPQLVAPLLAASAVALAALARMGARTVHPERSAQRAVEAPARARFDYWSCSPNTCACVFPYG